MVSSHTRRWAVGLLALAMTGAATNAFAIRNRYTNEQNEGFAALFFDAFGRPGFADERPIARSYRHSFQGGSEQRYDGRGDAPFTY